MNHSAVVVLALLGACLVALVNGDNLRTYNIDTTGISTSGLSAGAFFAVQFHVAHSKMLIGNGVVGGGPFHCAQGNMGYALTYCMKYPSFIDVAGCVEYTKSASPLDDPSNLQNQKVYMFSGLKDTIVVQGVMEKLEEYYKSFVAADNIVTVFNISAGHSMITNNYGNPCDAEEKPFIDNCNYDAAYAMLTHFYGNLTYGTQMVESNLLEFDQREFFTEGILDSVSMDETGFVYVPTACQNLTNKCTLHIAFHGCTQGRVFLGNEYALHAGYNQHAESNNMIVLYPQVTKNLMTNPQGCFDWWGYTDQQYATQDGKQIVGVKKMIDRLSGQSIHSPRVLKVQA